jgi:hypothetical protein
MEDGVLDVDVHFGWDYHAAYHLKHSREVYETLSARLHVARGQIRRAEARRAAPSPRRSDTPEWVRSRCGCASSGASPAPRRIPTPMRVGRVLEADFRAEPRRPATSSCSRAQRALLRLRPGQLEEDLRGRRRRRRAPTAEMPDGPLADRVRRGLRHLCHRLGLLPEPGQGRRRRARCGHHDQLQQRRDGEPGADFLDVFIEEGPDGHVIAWRVSEFLRALDGTSPWFSTMYGLHGIDDNPRGTPGPTPSLLCEACRADRLRRRRATLRPHGRRAGLHRRVHRRRRLRRGLHVPERPGTRHHQRPRSAPRPARGLRRDLGRPQGRPGARRGRAQPRSRPQRRRPGRGPHRRVRDRPQRRRRRNLHRRVCDQRRGRPALHLPPGHAPRGRGEPDHFRRRHADGRRSRGPRRPFAEQRRRHGAPAGHPRRPRRHPAVALDAPARASPFDTDPERDPVTAKAGSPAPHRGR